MKMALTRISIALLLAAGAVSAVANPYGREEREAAHAARQQQREARPEQREALRGEVQLQRQEEQRRREAAPPQQVAPEQARRPGKLSPEERRALRQQIDEAGHDIYKPRH